MIKQELGVKSMDVEEFIGKVESFVKGGPGRRLRLGGL